MRRNAPLVLTLLLLVATATAFAVTQRLKLEPSPISQTRVDEVFSPVCGCDSRAATIEFHLRHADHLRIAIQVDGREVTIANREFQRGLVRVRWDGKGFVDGVYYPVVHLRRSGRTIDLPNPIRIDTVRPTITFLGLRRVGRKTTITYRVSEPAHAILFVDGRREVYTYSTRRLGRFNWYGLLSPGNPPRLVLAAEDLAGNRSTREPLKAA